MAKEDAVTFTPREMEVLALAWQCFESEPKIDIKKLARLTGYTEGSASVTIGKIKRKLKIHAASNKDGGDDDGTPPATTPKKTPAKTPKSTGKRAANTASSVQDTPAKKRKAPTGSTSEPVVFQEEEEEEEFKLKTEVDDEVEVGGYDGFYRY